LADAKVRITVRPLSEWTEDELRRLYRLAVGHVRQLMKLPDDDPRRAEHLEGAQSDAALYGEELVRRGVL